MNTDTSQNPTGQHHQPSQGTQPDHQDEPYFGASARGADAGPSDGLKLAVVALAIVGATAIGLALIFRSVDESANARTANVTSPIAEHNQLMREAVQLAREAQEMNRRRMSEMRQAMQEADGYAEYGESSEYGEHPGSNGYYADP